MWLFERGIERRHDLGDGLEFQRERGVDVRQRRFQRAENHDGGALSLYCDQRLHANQRFNFLCERPLIPNHA